MSWHSAKLHGGKPIQATRGRSIQPRRVQSGMPGYATISATTKENENEGPKTHVAVSTIPELQITIA